MTRILIFDGAPRLSQQRIAAYGAPFNSALFETALALHDPGVACTTLNVADGEQLPAGTGLSAFDGVVVTGSPLNIYDGGEAVTRQIEAARAVFAARLPVWGSCWGLQLLTTALGGTVRLSPNGRELGVARNIALTAAGRGHPIFAGKPDAFDALCSHIDEVETIPDGARVLATNGHSGVQAMELERDGISVVGVQYHPEHVFATTAAIVDARRSSLVREGTARAEDDLDGLVDDLRALHVDPSRRDLAWRYGLDHHVTDAALRSVEIGNWLKTKVASRRTLRAAAA